MDQKSGLPSFSEADIKKVFGTSEGQALLRILTRDGGNTLRQAANALKSGNTALAQNIVGPLLQSQEASELIKKISRK